MVSTFNTIWIFFQNCLPSRCLPFGMCTHRFYPLCFCIVYAIYSFCSEYNIYIIRTAGKWILLYLKKKIPHSFVLQAVVRLTLILLSSHSYVHIYYIHYESLKKIVDINVFFIYTIFAQVHQKNLQIFTERMRGRLRQYLRFELDLNYWNLTRNIKNPVFLRYFRDTYTSMYNDKL